MLVVKSKDLVIESICIDRKGERGVKSESQGADCLLDV